jgi:hypothetical protein
VEDVRISKMQEMLENTAGKIQSLHITATVGNVTAIKEAIVNLQAVYNTLAIMQDEQRETGGDENGRETDIS